MSYKYLYGFTNEPSYDFTKVIYFGKQDRCTQELKRVTEHYRPKDPNHDALSNAKYVLFARIDVGVGLSDLEAYFIQTYNPEFNTIYNEDRCDTLKLSEEDLHELQPLAEKLKWYLIKNTKEDSLNVDAIIREIQAMDDTIETASFCFAGREELLKTPIDKLRSIFEQHPGLVVILPEYPNSILTQLYKVDLYNESVTLSKFNRLKENKFDRICQIYEYREYSQAFYIPEINLSVAPDVIRERDCIAGDFHETSYLDDVKEIALAYFKKVLFLIASDLQEKEPAYIKNLSLVHFSKDINSILEVNGGFNSTHYGLCQGLRLMTKNNIAPLEDYETYHLANFLDGSDEYKRIINMPLSDFIIEYQSLSLIDLEGLDELTTNLTPQKTVDLLTLVE